MWRCQYPPVSCREGEFGQLNTALRVFFGSKMAKLAIIIVVVYLTTALGGAAIIWWPMKWGLDHNRDSGFSLLQLWVTFSGFSLALLGGGLTLAKMEKKPDLLLSTTQETESRTSGQHIDVLHLSVTNLGTGVAKAFLITFLPLSDALKPSIDPAMDDEKWFVQWMSNPAVEYIKIENQETVGFWSVNNQGSSAQFNTTQLPCFAGGTPVKIGKLGLNFRSPLTIPSFGINYTIEFDGKINKGNIIVLCPK